MVQTIMSSTRNENKHAKQNVDFCNSTQNFDFSTNVYICCLSDTANFETIKTALRKGF